MTCCEAWMPRFRNDLLRSAFEFHNKSFRSCGCPGSICSAGRFSTMVVFHPLSADWSFFRVVVLVVAAMMKNLANRLICYLQWRLPNCSQIPSCYQHVFWGLPDVRTPSLFLCFFGVVFMYSVSEVDMIFIFGVVLFLIWFPYNFVCISLVVMSKLGIEQELVPVTVHNDHRFLFKTSGSSDRQSLTFASKVEHSGLCLDCEIGRIHNLHSKSGKNFS